MKRVLQRDGRKIITIHRILLILFIVILFTSVYLDSFLFIPSLSEGKRVPLETGWILSHEGAVVESGISLPHKISGGVNGKTYTLSNTLPDTFPSTNASFTIETSMRSLDILLDGESIYSYALQESPWKRPVLGGSVSHYVRLPDWAPGHEISLVMSFYSNNPFAGIVQLPTIGSKADQIIYQMRELPNLIFGLLFLFTGVVCVLTSLGIRKGKQRKSLWYFGWIEVALGAWVFTQNCTKFIIIPNSVLALNFSYMALYLLPYFLLQYVRTSYSIVKRVLKPFIITSDLFIGAYVLVGLLQFLGVIQYSDTLLYAGLGLILFIIAIFAVLLIEFLQGNRDVLSFLAAVGVLLLTVTGEVVLLMLSIILENALFVHAGMALSGAILLYHSTKVIARGYRSEVHGELLLNLVHTDSLTGVGSRASYENRVSSMTGSGRPSKPTGILMVDINNLRAINDTYGREAGDNVLKDLALQLMELEPGRSEVYRIGGDEFFVFFDSITYEQMSLLCTDVQQKEYRTHECTYSAACGYSFYVTEKEKPLEEVIIEADANMYDCKAGRKRADAAALDS